jgi:putative phosphoribosyl transferase
MNPINKNTYFESRKAVGKIFAKQLEYLKNEKVTVLAVSPGGLLIGSEIAKLLDSEVGMLQLKHVGIPGDSNLGVINNYGGFTYAQNISKGEIEEYNLEYRNSIEANKFNAMHSMHVMSGIGELSPKDFLDKNVIIVTDFARTGTSIKAALDFLKHASPKFIVIVTAVAQTGAIDIMHQFGDKVLCLHATDKDFGSDHYFDDNSIPDNEDVIKILSRAVIIK